MAGGSVTVNMSSIQARIREQAEQRTLRFGNRVLNTSRRLAPVDTGQLRSSGKLVRTPSYIAIVYDAEHARFVVYGTRYVRGRNFPLEAYHDERRKGI